MGARAANEGFWGASMLHSRQVLGAWGRKCYTVVKFGGLGALKGVQSSRLGAFGRKNVVLLSSLLVEAGFRGFRQLEGLGFEDFQNPKIQIVA